MTNVIEVNFQKQEHKPITLQLSDLDNHKDARVYAYYLYDLMQEINSHFWNNYTTATTELNQAQAYEFDHHICSIKKEIDGVLDYLYNNQDNDGAYRMLKMGYNTDIKLLLNWIKEIGVPFEQENVINIKNFIGLHR